MRESIKTYPPDIVESLPREQLTSEYLSLATAYSIRGIELKDSEERCIALHKEASENKKIAEKLYQMLSTAVGFIDGLKSLAFKERETEDNVFFGEKKKGTLKPFLEEARTTLQDLKQKIGGIFGAKEKKAQTGPSKATKPTKDKQNDPSDTKQEEGQQDQKTEQKKESAGINPSDPEPPLGQPPAKKKEDAGEEPPKKRKGNPYLRRKKNFVINSFVDKENVILKIDPIWGTLEEIQNQLGVTDPSDIRLSTDFQTYIKAELVDGRAFPTIHLGPKFRSGNNTWRNPHGERQLHASIYDPTIMKHIILMKYAVGVPLNRNEKLLFRGMNLNLQRSSVEKWLETLYDDLGLKYLLFEELDYLKELAVRLGDETYINLIEKEGNSYYWGLRSSELDPDAVQLCIFLFDTSRSTLIPQFYFEDMVGILVTDAYASYPLFKKRTGNVITLALCWIHARRTVGKCALSRKQLEAHRAKYGEEHWTKRIWDLIGVMFDEERPLKDLSPEERCEKRNGKMREAAQEILTIAKKVKAELPEYHLDDDCKKAIDYIVEHEAELFVIFKDGRVPLTTNSLEVMNIIIALGKKNWKMYQTFDGAFRGGAFHSLVASAKASKVNIDTYIEFVVFALPYICMEIGPERLRQFDAYWEKRYERLEEARERMKKRPGQDPELDLSNLGVEKPDLSAFRKLFPGSIYHRAFAAMKEAKEKELHETIADAISIRNLMNSCFTTEQIIRVLEGLLKGTKVPEETHNSIRRILEKIKQMAAQKPEAEPANKDPNSIEGVVFADRSDMTPEFLTNPEAVIERYGEPTYSFMADWEEEPFSEDYPYGQTPAGTTTEEADTNKEEHAPEVLTEENPDTDPEEDCAEEETDEKTITITVTMDDNEEPTVTVTTNEPATLAEESVEDEKSSGDGNASEDEDLSSEEDLAKGEGLSDEEGPAEGEDLSGEEGPAEEEDLSEEVQKAKRYYSQMWNRTVGETPQFSFADAYDREKHVVIIPELADDSMKFSDLGMDTLPATKEGGNNANEESKQKDTSAVGLPEDCPICEDKPPP